MAKLIDIKRNWKNCLFLLFVVISNSFEIDIKLLAVIIYSQNICWWNVDEQYAYRGFLVDLKRQMRLNLFLYEGVQDLICRHGCV